MNKPTAGDAPKFVIITATKQELFDIGMCSNQTFKWLTNEKVKRVKSVEHNAYGRRMFYLHGENDNEISSWWGWVYEDMCLDVTEEVEQVMRPIKERLQPMIGLPVDEDTKKQTTEILRDTIDSLPMNTILERHRIKDDYGQKEIGETSWGKISNVAQESVTSAGKKSEVEG